MTVGAFLDKLSNSTEVICFDRGWAKIKDYSYIPITFNKHTKSNLKDNIKNKNILEIWIYDEYIIGLQVDVSFSFWFDEENKVSYYSC